MTTEKTRKLHLWGVNRHKTTSHMFSAASHSWHTSARTEMQTCTQAHSSIATDPRSNRWRALRQSLRDLCEGRAANWLLRSGVRLHKGTSCSFQVSALYSPRDKWRHKTTVASVAGNDPFTKNLDNDIPRPFVAVKITVAHSELHVCPPATCAGAVRPAWSYSLRSAVSRCWSWASESGAGWNGFSLHLLLIQPESINLAAHIA